LESEYQDFKDPRHRLADGTPKEWIYFLAFEIATTNSPLEDSEGFVEKIRHWLRAKPDSIPALLALDNALLGQCQQLQALATAQHALDDPEITKQFKARSDEIISSMQSFPKDRQEALFREPEISSVMVHSYILSSSAGYEHFKQVQNDVHNSDRFYAPYYCNALTWLSTRRKHHPELPRPEVWLTDQFRLDGLESVDEAKQKSEAYAQVVAFDNPEKVFLTPQLMDWSTLKIGLKNLVEDYGPNTDWPSRYLLTAYQERDKESTKEAYGLVAGNPSPDVMSSSTYQEIQKWIDDETP
jgi:hypothetical protein